MCAPVFIKEKPEMSGFYYLRIDGAVDVVKVLPSGKILEFGNTEHFNFSDYMPECEWCGPI